MNKIIIYKEWLKTRFTFFVGLAISIALALYVLLNLHRIEVSKGVDHIWLIMLMKDQTFVDVIKFFPPLFGLALGVSQMLPEVLQKRLKLTLHLPVGMYHLIGIMMLMGLVEIIAISGIQALIIGCYYAGIISHELIWRVLLTITPWYLAGITAYIVCTAVCIEGTWSRRLVLSGLGVTCICFYYAQNVPEAYNSCLTICFIFTIMLCLCTFNSVIRFKEGLQD